MGLYLVPSIVLSIILGVVFCWWLEPPPMLVFPAAPVVPWLYIRYTTPQEGLVTERITSHPKLVSYLVFLACWCGVAVVGGVLLEISGVPMPAASIIGGTALVLWFGILLWRSSQLDRVRRKREEEDAVSSVLKWDEGEAAPKEFNVD